MQGQTIPDSLTTICLKDGYTTIRSPKQIRGVVLNFCNGLSMDFGETYGLVILEQKNGKIINVLLNSYKHYEFKKGTRISFKVESFFGRKENKYCIPLNGDYIVKLKK